jgi:dynein heavy chain 1
VTLIFLFKLFLIFDVLFSAFCKGESKASNVVRSLIASITRGSVPPGWQSQYSVLKSMTVGSWMIDLAERSKATLRHAQILGIGGAGKTSLLGATFWLGGMFSPEAFITASRQATAQTNKWSLEDLELSLDIGVSACDGVQDTVVEGLTLEGVSWRDGAFALSAELRSKLPPSRLRWSLRSKRTSAPDADKYVLFPMYLNESRQSVVAEVLLKPPSYLPQQVWSQRGVAFSVQSSL